MCCITGEFVVDPETGIIYTRRPLDREVLSHYTLRVRAQNDVISASGDSSDVTVVFIQVIDVNDHAPEVTYPLPDSAIHLQQKAVVPGTRLIKPIKISEILLHTDPVTSYTHIHKFEYCFSTCLSRH